MKKLAYIAHAYAKAIVFIKHPISLTKRRLEYVRLCHWAFDATMVYMLDGKASEALVFTDISLMFSDDVDKINTKIAKRA